MPRPEDSPPSAVPPTAVASIRHWAQRKRSLAGLRDGSAGLPSMWLRNASPGRHHPARGRRHDPRPPRRHGNRTGVRYGELTNSLFLRLLAAIIVRRRGPAVMAEPSTSGGLDLAGIPTDRDTGLLGERWAGGCSGSASLSQRGGRASGRTLGCFCLRGAARRPGGPSWRAGGPVPHRGARRPSRHPTRRRGVGTHPPPRRLGPLFPPRPERKGQEWPAVFTGPRRVARGGGWRPGSRCSGCPPRPGAPLATRSRYSPLR